MKKYSIFYANLKEKGYKLTSQRKIIFDAILAHNEKHVTADEIYQFIKKEHPEIGIATVYRNVQLLSDMNIVEKLNLDDGFTRYKLVLDDEKHRHHHLICNSCNTIIEVREDLMDSIEKLFDENYGFLVSDHQTKFFGLCQNCRKAK